MKHLVITTLMVVVFYFGANLVQAPKVEAVSFEETSNSNITLKSVPFCNPDLHLIYQIPDLRAAGMGPCKSVVFAEDGQSIAVIYCRYSSDPTNIMQLYVAYSTNRGISWFHYGPLSTFNARRCYAGLDAEDNFHLTGRVHYIWHQAAQISGSYDSSPAYYAKDVMFPDGLITAVYRLPNSGTWDVWLPSIAVKDSFIIAVATNIGSFLTTFDNYIWRSTVYGELWDEGRLFISGPTEKSGSHFRFGSNGYVFLMFLQQIDERSWPYYCESFDYGQNWTQPQLIWQNTPPYPDMSNVTCWASDFDCEVVRDTSVAAIKLSTGMFALGEIWVYRPDSGTQGNWHFKGKKLVGGDSTAPLPIARWPNVSADDSGNTIVGYYGPFINIMDSIVWDVGAFARPAIEDTWYDWGRVIFSGDTFQKSFLEFAHNAPLIANGDSIIVGMIYTDAGDHPTTGNLYFDWFWLPNPPIPTGISENQQIKQLRFDINISPNPFRNSVKFVIPAFVRDITISIFDVSGKLITSIKPTITSNYFVWDGKKSDGSIVNPGVYFYNISSGGFRYQGKVILTR